MKFLLTTVFLVLMTSAAFANGKGNGQILCKIEGKWVPFENCLIKYTDTFRGIENLPSKNNPHHKPVFNKHYKDGTDFWLNKLDAYTPMVKNHLYKKAQGTTFVYVAEDLSLVPDNYQDLPIVPKDYIVAAVYHKDVVYVSIQNMDKISGDQNFTKTQQQGFVLFHEIVNAGFKKLKENERIKLNAILMKAVLEDMNRVDFYVEFGLLATKYFDLIKADTTIGIEEKLEAIKIANQFKPVRRYFPEEAPVYLRNANALITGDLSKVVIEEPLKHVQLFSKLEARADYQKELCEEFGMSFKEVQKRHKSVKNPLIGLVIEKMSFRKLYEMVFIQNPRLPTSEYHYSFVGKTYPTWMRSIIAKHIFDTIESASLEQKAKYYEAVSRVYDSHNGGVTPSYNHSNLYTWTIWDLRNSFSDEDETSLDKISLRDFMNETLKMLESEVIFNYFKAKFEAILKFNATNDSAYLKLIKENYSVPGIDVKEKVGGYKNYKFLSAEQRTILDGIIQKILVKINSKEVLLKAASFLRSDFGLTSIRDDLEATFLNKLPYMPKSLFDLEKNGSFLAETYNTSAQDLLKVQKPFPFNLGAVVTIKVKRHARRFHNRYLGKSKLKIEILRLEEKKICLKLKHTRTHALIKEEVCIDQNVFISDAKAGNIDFI